MTSRLEKIIHRINRAFARRKALGLPTEHLLSRVRHLSAAYLESRHQDLCH